MAIKLFCLLREIKLSQQINVNFAFFIAVYALSLDR